MAELARPKHVPWFKQAYCKYAKGQRFIKDIHGCKMCSGLTLTRKHQPYKVIGRKGEQLTAAATTDPGRLLTQKMLEQDLYAPLVTYIDANINAYTARMVTKEQRKQQNAQQKNKQ